MDFDITITSLPNQSGILLEAEGGLVFETLIQEAHLTSSGDYELVSYEGEEYGFVPSTRKFVVFGSDITIMLSNEECDKLNQTLSDVFDTKE